jgi:hypothetical protein
MLAAFLITVMTTANVPNEWNASVNDEGSRPPGADQRADQ